MSSEDNKRVAKNAIALTLRMVLVTIVGLYTSRIVLETLGVDDYGIYGVIGGVVGMASFLNTSMTGATSRFITFELGKGYSEKLRKTFSTAFYIHLGLAIVVVLLAETVGLWFVNHKMVFPSDRLLAVNILYQLSIISMLVNFTQVPYAADIIAHEKLSIYAYFEIINVMLKLIIVWLLLVIPSDRLILYAVLMLLVSILSALFYRYYCRRNFQEARLSTKINRNVAKDMLSFSAYELYGNMCVVAKNQGEPIILNIFFGVVANAAASLALTVAGAIDGLTTSISAAFSPQIVKQYASDNITGMALLMRRALQFTLLAYSLIAIPCILEARTVLYLWLGQIPKFSIIFLQLVLIAAIPQIIARINIVAIRATGHNRTLSLTNGTFYLIIPVISYILFKCGFTDASIIYIVGIIMLSVCVYFSFLIIKIEIKNLNFRTYSFPAFKSILSISLSFILCYLIKKYFLAGDIEQGLGWLYNLFQFVGRFLIYGIIIAGVTLILAFDSSEKAILFKLLRKSSTFLS